MPASRISASHFAISDLIVAANSSGVVASVVGYGLVTAVQQAADVPKSRVAAANT